MPKTPKPLPPRVTVHVGHELRQQIEAAKDQINWSEVAQQAFRAALNKLNEDTKMLQVIERMKAAEPTSMDYHSGLAEGQAWAKNHAKRSELQRLHRYLEQKSQILDYVKLDHQTPAQWLARVILNTCDQRKLANFIELIGCEDENNVDWVEGFGEGALAVWCEVKSRL
jgi:hypothetical protein